MGRGTGRRERRHEKLEEALDGLVVSGREKANVRLTNSGVYFL